MSDEIKVLIVKFPDRTNLMLKYIDPVTGKQKYKSAGTTNRKDAGKGAGKWELELRTGVVQPSKVSWVEFRQKYENEVLDSLAWTTDLKAQGRLNAVEKYLNPQRLRDVTAERLSFLQSQLRLAGLAEATIKGHIVGIMAALRWAVKIGWLPRAPEVNLPKRAKGSTVMKGRPITGEEFDRLLAAIPKALDRGQTVSNPTKLEARNAERKAAVRSWEHFLRGLWLSGLRLTESLELTWDDASKLQVDLQAGEHPMLRIPAEHEKGHQDRLLPIAPEFAEFLQATSQADRTGYVFNPRAVRKCGPRLMPHRVSELVTAIGKQAGVKVKTEAGGAVKFASAHDLRRSFGERWASRVMPQVLKELMRHESIDTTLRYYVGRNAQATAAVLWEAHKAAGYTSGYTPANGGSNQEKKTPRKIVAATGFEPVTHGL